MNLYSVLGVNQNANEDEIKKAYRLLAKKFHPDVNQNNQQAEIKFTEISKAYEILGNPKKRKDYDEKNVSSTPKLNNANKSQGEPFDFAMSGKAFESFFGFNSRTGEITNEEKLKSKKNPLDTSAMFESFMKMKK